MVEFCPATQPELSRFLRENADGTKQALFPVGGRTALHYGYPAAETGVTTSTTSLCEIIDYPARDMTITVEAGVRMQELAATLKAEGQQLPIDVSQSHRATLGGVIATNTSGPRRFGCGTIRDYLIGVAAVDAQGKQFHAGGRVVKNVAGYDLCKLLVGSLGTLAIISQVTLKLRPLPETSGFLWASFSSIGEIDAALEKLLTSSARPVVIDVLNAKAASQTVVEARLDLPHESPVLCLGVEGTAREVEWQLATLQQELIAGNPRDVSTVGEDEADLLSSALTEFPASSDDPLTFQASLLPSCTIDFLEQGTLAGVALQAHAGNGVVVGHLPDDASSTDAALKIVQPLRKSAQDGGGHLVVLNCDDEWKPHISLFGDAGASWNWMRKMKLSLDPNNLLNPGRLIDSAST